MRYYQSKTSLGSSKYITFPAQKFFNHQQLGSLIKKTTSFVTVLCTVIKWMRENICLNKYNVFLPIVNLHLSLFDRLHFHCCVWLQKYWMHSNLSNEDSHRLSKVSVTASNFSRPPHQIDVVLEFELQYWERGSISVSNIPASVADPWYIGVDPDPRIHASD